MISKQKPRAEYTGEHLIALDRFIQATRDSGYKGTGSAVAELVDNALQAGATRIDILVAQVDGDANSLMLEVSDNGCGMSAATLTQAVSSPWHSPLAFFSIAALSCSSFVEKACFFASAFTS